MSTTSPAFDTLSLRSQVQDMYTKVALEPHARFHFEMGRALAERLGYSETELTSAPAESIDSFAGVGYYFQLANLQAGESVLDLGSGAGMDAFIASSKVGGEGKVVGLDMTKAQLQKAEELKTKMGVKNVDFVEADLPSIPLASGSVDVVISNGVINLIPDKESIFREIARVLRKGGRMAISDILTDKQLTENITCDVGLWASCIGGATQKDVYRELIESAGLSIIEFTENPQYAFLSKSAIGASKDFGVKSVSLLAVRG